VQHNLKPISRAGIAEANSKVEVYRYLNEPGEAESICRDILAIEPDNQPSLRLLGLSITDQFKGEASDRYTEAENIFRSLTDPYNRVLHVNRGRPLTSAEHEPHLPALQFQRTARSGA